MGTAARLESMYRSMLDSLGSSGWWPGETPFEVCVGAILTQNTAWANVEKAIAALQEAECMEPQAMYALPPEELAALIRPAGYFNIKAARLRGFLELLRDRCDWNLAAFDDFETGELRNTLLSVKGIGPETADSMLLYAFGRPVFVVDAYTARMFARHGMVSEEVEYHELQALFMDALDQDVALYNEFHALIVRTGKDWCKKKAPLCETCPLKTFLD